MYYSLGTAYVTEMTNISFLTGERFIVVSGHNDVVL